MTASDIIQIVCAIICAISSTAAVFVAVYFSKESKKQATRVEELEKRQDIRDEKRYRNIIEAGATRFIQECSDEPYIKEHINSFVNLCQAAYLYNPVHAYNREIYRKYCCLTDEERACLLARLNIKPFSNVRVCQLRDVIQNNVPQTSLTMYLSPYEEAEKAMMVFGKNKIEYYRCPTDNELEMFHKNGYDTLYDDYQFDDTIFYLDKIQSQARSNEKLPLDNLLLTPVAVRSASFETKHNSHEFLSYVTCVYIYYHYQCENNPDILHSGIINTYEDLFLAALANIVACTSSTLSKEEDYE